MKLFKLVALTAIAAIATGSCSNADEPGASPAAPRTTTSPPIASTLNIKEPREFVPPTYQESGKTVLPLVFPDGTTAELVYPTSLRIAQMGLRPYRAGGFRNPFRDGRDFAIFYKGVPRVWRAGGAPLATYETVTGSPAEYWDTADSWDPEDSLRHLILRLGSWYVAIWDRGTLTERQLTLWARNLRATETKNGFLILEAKRPLRLTGEGDKAGPELMFEGGDPDRRIKNRPMLLLFVNRCRDYSREGSAFKKVQMVNGRGIDRSSRFANFCYQEANMVVHVGGSERFVDRLVRSLKIRRVTLRS